MGPAGTKMPTARVEPFNCGTDFSGWLKDGLEDPVVGDGIVSRKVCFSDRTRGCRKEIKISVKNCGSYSIYNLIKPPLCNMRYCGTD